MAAKVLIIDDSPTALALMREALGGEGFAVITAETGMGGVEKAISENPDLVITDTVLPDINGFEVCRKIREGMGKDKPKIIVITGNIDAVDAIQARKCGADDYAVKSADPTTLIETAQRLMKNA